MISKSTIPAMMFLTMGLASPAFAQVPPGYYYDYSGPAAYADPYEQPPPYSVAPYDYGGWSPRSGFDYNIHTPPNH